MKEKIKQLCESYCFGSLIDEPVMVTGGLMHKMYHVITDEGEYAVKVLNPDIMQRPEAMQNMINSELVSNRLQSQIPVVAAKDFSGKHVIECAGFYYMVFEWLDGKSVFVPEISEYHCEQIGKILGKIHAADITIDGMEQRQEKRSTYDWQGFLEEAEKQQSECACVLRENLEMLYRMNQAVIESAHELADTQVISHCDLDPKNVMWKEEQPYIIDWEAAGYVNPYQELIEVLNYWAVDETGKHDKKKFDVLVDAYTEKMDIGEVNWAAVLNCSFDGMLGWLAYNVKRALGLKGTSDNDRQEGRKQVTGTILELKKQESQMNQLKDWLNQRA